MKGKTQFPHSVEFVDGDEVDEEVDGVVDPVEGVVEDAGAPVDDAGAAVEADVVVFVDGQVLRFGIFWLSQSEK